MNRIAIFLPKLEERIFSIGQTAGLHCTNSGNVGFVRNISPTHQSRSAPDEILWFSVKFKQALCSLCFLFLFPQGAGHVVWGIWREVCTLPWNTAADFQEIIHPATHAKYFQQVYPQGVARVSRHL